MANEGEQTVNEPAYRDAERKLWQSVKVQPDEKLVRLETTGTEVRLQIIGDGDPVLFIHGGPNSGSTWAPIVNSFPGYTCILVDRPGTGLSEALPEVPDPRRFLEIADGFVADVLDGIGIKRSDVVASSLGGFIALRSAAVAPDRFGRMVQMACPAMAPDMKVPPFMRMMSLTWFRRLTGLFPPNARINRSILRQIGHGKSLDAGSLSPGFLDWYLELGRHTDTLENDGNLIGSLLGFGGADPSLTLDDALLSSVIAPTLFLWGEDDGFCGEDVARRTVDPIPDAELEMIPDSGHLPWLDFPDRIGARAREFLANGS